MSTPLITLTTDLGLYDHYVGVMKGVIWSIVPEVNIVDLSHDINPFDIVEAAFKLECAYRFFPLRSVHVMVVDPGVGSSRRAILAVGDTHYFIGPDNGVLSWVFESNDVSTVYEINASHYYLSPVSNTFHGRDIFAPVAANLIRQQNPANFGDEIDNYRRFKLPKCEKTGKNAVSGKLISIDRFGNCITNISRAMLEEVIGSDNFSHVRVTIGGKTISGIASFYAERKPKTPLALVGNADYLELAVNKGNAARELQLRKNMDVTVTL